MFFGLNDVNKPKLDPVGQLEAPEVDDNTGSSEERSEFKRLREVMDDVSRGAVKLEAHPAGLCRWTREGGFLVLRSLGTKSYYAVAEATASFFRGKSPDTCRMQRCSPREVIAVDRQWIEQIVDALPEGLKGLKDAYHARWTPGANAAKREEKRDTVNNTVTNAMASKTAPLPPAPLPKLGLTVSEVRCTVLVEREKSLELRLDQVLDLLTRAGAKPAPSSVIEPMPAGFRVVSEDATSVSGACYDEVVTSRRSYVVSAAQLAAILASTAGIQVVVSPATRVEVTPEGYVKLRWVEQSEEQR